MSMTLKPKTNGNPDLNILMPEKLSTKQMSEYCFLEG